MEKLLKRKIDKYLTDWKNRPDRKPLIIKGARQIGKTRSVEWFAGQNYASVIEINFIEQKKYREIFNDGFEVDAILKNISLLNPEVYSRQYHIFLRRASGVPQLRHVAEVF